MPPDTFVIVRSLPPRVTARGFAALPLSLDVNQISSPERDQARPVRSLHSLVKRLALPEASTVASGDVRSVLAFSHKKSPRGSHSTDRKMIVRNIRFSAHNLGSVPN